MSGASAGEHWARRSFEWSLDAPPAGHAAVPYVRCRRARGVCVERGGVCARERELVRVIARLRVVVWFGRSRSALVRCVSVFVAPPARSLARLAGGRLVGSGVVSHTSGWACGSCAGRRSRMPGVPSFERALVSPGACGSTRRGVERDGRASVRRGLPG